MVEWGALVTSVVGDQWPVVSRKKQKTEFISQKSKKTGSKTRFSRLEWRSTEQKWNLALKKWPLPRQQRRPAQK